MPKRVTSFRAHLRVITLEQPISFRRISQQWRAIGNTGSDLICRRFEPHTNSSRDIRVTAPLTGRSIPFHLIVYFYSIILLV